MPTWQTGKRKKVNNKTDYKKGLTGILCCELIWGMLPIYWQSLRPIDSFVIIMYRVVLMALFCYIVTAFRMKTPKVFGPMFAGRKAFLTYFAAGIVIMFNWSLYIWAVNANYVIQTAMGYYLEPLIVCLFGVVLYKEKANKWKVTAFLFACAGIAVMIIGYRQAPLIAIGLAVSFAIYAAIKKSVFLDPLQSMLYETILLMPLCAIGAIYMEINGNGAFGNAAGYKIALLALAGVCTAAPLGLFSFAANKMPLITIGMLSYLSPSLSLILGIFILKEDFDAVQFSAFAIIWVGLVFFTHGEISDYRRSRNALDPGQDNSRTD